MVIGKRIIDFMPKFLFHYVLLPLLLLCSLSVRANDLTIEVVGGGTNRHAIALPEFGLESALPGGLTPIIQSDLARTGVFSFVDPNKVNNRPIDPAQIDYPAWLGAGTMSIAVGKVTAGAGGTITVEFHLFDAARKTRLTGASFSIQPNQSRQLAHRIADMIYEAITGKKGIFGTRIAYVIKHSANSYSLQVADADGANGFTLLRSSEPIISPAWSPEGGRLAYVSFESKKPVVYVHDVSSGSRRAVANFKGSNSAPAWSPDGSRLAVVLTRDGHSQIYAVSANGGEAVRLSNSNAIDTEPAYSADGSRIYFTSDRAGGPQIYVMGAGGGSAQRVTFEGNYNVSPTPAPDGTALAFVRREAGRFRVMVQETATGQANYVTDTHYDESPSFAPNGQMLVYASEQGGRGVLFTDTRDGSTKTRLTTSGGDIRAPVWGPYPR